MHEGVFGARLAPPWCAGQSRTFETSGNLFVFVVQTAEHLAHLQSQRAAASLGRSQASNAANSAQARVHRDQIYRQSYPKDTYADGSRDLEWTDNNPRNQNRFDEQTDHA